MSQPRELRTDHDGGGSGGVGGQTKTAIIQAAQGGSSALNNADGLVLSWPPLPLLRLLLLLA